MNLELFLRGGEQLFSRAADFLAKYIPNLDSRFLYPGGLILAVFILPLIIFYLIRPKPQKRTISSVMFLMVETGRSFVKTFFRTFIKDALFFIQLLAIILMVLAVARPFVDVPELSIAKPTVIIIDGSASMTNRFSEAKDSAKDSLSALNTIILAKNLPQTIAIEQPKSKAGTIITSLDSGHTETNLYDALILAPRYLRDEGRVVVISDFAVDTSYLTAKKFVESMGHSVHLKKVGKSISNVGIVDLEITDRRTIVSIKNYNQNPETVRLKVNNELVDTMTLEPFSSDIMTFSTPAGVSELEIDVNDEFKADNKAFISAPLDHNLNVLIVTNDNAIRNFDFVIALDAINSNTSTKVSYEIATPPKVPNIYHDVVIFKNVDPDLLLPGTIDETLKKVREGGACIIMAQEGLFGINFRELLPYTYKQTEREALVSKSQLSLTENIEFGTVGTYFVVEPHEGVIEIASTGNSPVIGIKNVGKGITMYYGLFDESADFSKEPYYPIFWKRSLDLLTGRPELSTLNYRTGRIISLAERQQVNAPDGIRNTNALYLDKAGIYTVDNRKIGANLLSVSESDLNTDNWVSEIAKENIDRSPNPEPFDLSKYAIIAALAVVALELFYLKFRGDL